MKIRRTYIHMDLEKMLRNIAKEQNLYYLNNNIDKRMGTVEASKHMVSRFQELDAQNKKVLPAE